MYTKNRDTSYCKSHNYEWFSKLYLLKSIIISFKNSVDKYILDVNEYHYVSITTYTYILYKYTHLSQIELINIYLNKQINCFQYY